MTTQPKLQVIDADAHVIETEQTWEYLEPSEQKFRPRLYTSPDDPTKEYWVLDEKIRGFRFPSLTEQTLLEQGRRTGKQVHTPEGAKELDDLNLRLKHMDELGIDIQILHNTLWIEQVTNKADAEAALCRSYNKWMGSIWKRSNGRLRWTCVTPVLMLDEAIRQIREAKENGAVGVCLRPFEGDKFLIHSYFYPIFEEAERLDMPIAVHIANASPFYRSLFESVFENAGGFNIFRVPTVMVCLGLIASEVPQLFPKLRWAFIEASAMWMPWIWNEVAQRFPVQGKKIPADLFHDFNIFVTTQTDDDIPHILKYSGPKTLVIGTDYGHFDPASEVGAIEVFKQNERIDQSSKDRILHYNPKELYGI